MTGSDPLDHIWWIASRSAGVVAWLLLSASMLLGLAMATKVAPRAWAPRMKVAHERIALACMGSLAAHALLLLGDAYLHPSIIDLLVPFRISHAPAWTGIGVCAGYLVAGLSLSYYARARIGARRWRTAHRFLPIAWVMAAVHVVGSGSDIGSLWLQLPFALTIAAVLVLLGKRLFGSPPARPAARARRERPVAAGM
jgi:sulfoxide reductase heme-binding subunit YedZ